MVKIYQFTSLFLASLVSINWVQTVNAGPTATLTVMVNGIQNQKGQVCLRVFGNAKGFPFNDISEVQSGCAPIKGNSVKKQFFGLKSGTYAVAVVDDQNTDYKLNRNFLGIPEEGFGISNNPKISLSTGVPKFQDASFKLKRDTIINIVMKYSLDP